LKGKISEIKTIQPKCTNCGADLKFSPGEDSLECSFCGTLNRIDRGTDKSTGSDYRKILEELEKKEEFIESYTAKCNTCSSIFDVAGNISSTECPFCASPVIVEGGSTRRIKPKSVIPFKIDSGKAKEIFSKWVKKLWFAPAELKDRLFMESRLKGIYLPYWIFGMSSISYYNGERGDDHKENESYTTYENGKEVTKTNSITVTNWAPSSGVISRDFRDILISATDTVPKNHLKSIGNWKLDKAREYDDDYVSGFISECYSIGVTDGFSKAVQTVGEKIKAFIKSDIGGDHQKINSVRTTYDGISFKHVLFPVWISSFRFKKKNYNFMINGSTGKIYGQRPWSKKKLFLLFFSIAAVIAALVIIF